MTYITGGKNTINPSLNKEYAIIIDVRKLLKKKTNTIDLRTHSRELGSSPFGVPSISFREIKTQWSLKKI